MTMLKNTGSAKILVTGSGGLIGSEAAGFYLEKGNEVIGIDNNMRSDFFGKEGDVEWNIKRLKKSFPSYKHFRIDVRDENTIKELFQKNGPFNLIIHCAAQPSHDWAARDPLTDFDVNARATLILLENFRKYSTDGTFIFTSTNKVYGDSPNSLPFIEEETRFELSQDHMFFKGIDESMPIDQNMHSLFGVSKSSADLYVQEYGRYFSLNTGVFRGGCLTGPNHSGVKLHGFLSYLAKCIISGDPYTIFGYKGKQVRDNIHARDLISAFNEFAKAPRRGEVYNIGGSRLANVSILEAISKIESITNKKAVLNYVSQPRAGDHKWYISDISKFKSHYPNWNLKYSIDNTLEEICSHFMKK